MGTRPHITRPWQMVSASRFGALPRSTKWQEYVLVIVDYFSKFPLFVPMRQVTARKVTADRRVWRPVRPEQRFNQFLENYGVQPHFNLLYTPQNYPTERVNGTMKTLINYHVLHRRRPTPL
jgi:hypothetical protein